MIPWYRKQIASVARLPINTAADVRNLPHPFLAHTDIFCIKINSKKEKSSGIRNEKNSKGMNWWGMRRAEVRIEGNGFILGGAVGKNTGFNSHGLGVYPLYQPAGPGFGSWA